MRTFPAVNFVTMRSAAMLCATIAAVSLTLSANATPPTPDDAFKSYQAGDYSAAIEKFQATLQIAPNDARLHYGLGESYLKRNDVPHAQEQFQWVMLHSTDPQLRAGSNDALNEIAHPPAAARPKPQAPQQAATTATTQPSKNPTQAPELTPMEKSIQQAKARALQEKIKIMKEADDKCKAIDRDTQGYFQPTPGGGGMWVKRGSSAPWETSLLRKRQIQAEAQKKAAQWDEMVNQLTEESQHPGKQIQVVPQNLNPYVKSFVNMGGSEELPEEIVPLRATAQKFPAKPNAQNTHPVQKHQ